MKKIISLFIAGACLAGSIPASAKAEDYVPTLYFRTAEQDGVIVEDDGTIVIDRDQLLYGNYTLGGQVYIDDQSLSCWNVSPKWKSPSSFIKLENLLDPLPTNGENSVYAYAETDESGAFVSNRHGTIVSTDEELNTMSFTVQVSSLSDRSAMIPYGEKSDSYPVTSFDMNINSNIPYGEYEVYFLTESEDYADQRYSQVAMRTDSGSVVVTPLTERLKIRVDGWNLGDVDNDGLVTSSDASAVLAAYARLSTQQPHGLTEFEFSAGDINNDGMLDSSDASDILKYYAYLSTGGEQNFWEYSGYFGGDNGEGDVGESDRPVTTTAQTTTVQTTTVTTTTTALTTDSSGKYAYGTIVDYDPGLAPGSGWAMVTACINPDGSKSLLSMWDVDYQAISDYLYEVGWPTEDHDYYVYIGTSE